MGLARAHWRWLGYGALGTLIWPPLGVLLFVIGAARILVGVDEAGRS